MVYMWPYVKLFMYFFVLPFVIAKITKWGVLRSFFITLIITLFFPFVIHLQVGSFLKMALIHFNVWAFIPSIVFTICSILFGAIVLMSKLKIVNCLFFNKILRDIFL